jgi:hypothetical protein
MSVPNPGDLSEADRDHVVALLREHFAVNHFGVDEFSRRVETVLSAPTADAVTTAVADLPPLEQPVDTKARRSRWRRLVGARHAQTDAALAGWLPTSERFRDPSSGKLMRVWTDPADASRHYVPEASAPNP